MKSGFSQIARDLIKKLTLRKSTQLCRFLEMTSPSRRSRRRTGEGDSRKAELRMIASEGAADRGPQPEDSSRATWIARCGEQVRRSLFRLTSFD